MKHLALALLWLSPVAVAAAEPAPQYTKRVRNEVREGPGNYYPLVAVLPKGAPVSVTKGEGGWLNFSARVSSGGAVRGWIAKNCLSNKEAGKSMASLDLGALPQGVSPASVAAAVRGFALSYGRAKASALDSLQALKPPFFTPEQYRSFRSEMRPAEADLAGKLLAQDSWLLKDYEVSPREEGIGLGIAARVAARGLNDDRAFLGYLNMLGTSLAEASGAYDYPFIIYALKAKEVNAVAVPGGSIFLSEPLISACRDEAELSAVIAHEMTHVILRHGLKELGSRSVALRADAAQEELDREAGGEPDPDQEDLENWAEEAYNVVHKPRLQAYEEEADRGAALILARAGYDVSALPRMIARVGEAAAGTGSPFNKMDFKKRADAAEAFIGMSLPASGGMKNRERFEREAMLVLRPRERQ